MYSHKTQSELIRQGLISAKQGVSCRRPHQQVTAKDGSVWELQPESLCFHQYYRAGTKVYECIAVSKED